MPTFIFRKPIVVCNGLLVITPRSTHDGLGCGLFRSMKYLYRYRSLHRNKTVIQVEISYSNNCNF